MKGKKSKMKAFIKKMITTIGVFSLLAVPTVAVGVTSVNAQSNIDTGVCEGIEATGADDCREDNEGGFTTLMTRIINIFSIVVGAISVIMIIIGGFRYIISGGDSTGVTGAKNTIMYAIIGLVIVLFAQIIVRFVLTNVNTNSQ